MDPRLHCDTQMERDAEAAMAKRVQEVHHKYDIELERERKEMEERLKEFQSQSSAQQRTASKQMQEVRVVVVVGGRRDLLEGAPLPTPQLTPCYHQTAA